MSIENTVPEPSNIDINEIPKTSKETKNVEKVKTEENNQNTLFSEGNDEIDTVIISTDSNPPTIEGKESFIINSQSSMSSFSSESADPFGFSDDLLCSTCEISFCDQSQKVCHVKGKRHRNSIKRKESSKILKKIKKKHQKMLKTISVNKMPLKMPLKKPLKKPLKRPLKDITNKSIKIAKSEIKAEEIVFRCKTCIKCFYDVNNVIPHLKSKKHLKKVKALKLVKEFLDNEKSDSNALITIDKENIPDLCNRILQIPKKEQKDSQQVKIKQLTE